MASIAFSLPGPQLHAQAAVEVLGWAGGEKAGEPGVVNEFLNKLSPDTSLKISLLTCTTRCGLVN